MKKEINIIPILALLAAIITLMFGNNIYQQITGNSFFELLKDLGPLIPNWAIWLLIGIAIIIFLLPLIAYLVQVWETTYQPLLNRIRYRKHPRGNKRQRFAKYIFDEITRLDNLEEWSDYKFAELEAEVDAEDTWWATNLFFPVRRKKTGLHKEKSLSVALEKSSEKLILLEGEPGSGKSIALRHLAKKLAEDAAKISDPYSLIPLYINLRGLERQGSQKIDSNLIHEYILLSLNRINRRDVEEFLEKEFAKGIEENTWLFLFDSFDEIPEILSSTEADSFTNEYASAIENFMSGLNDCRAIIASREFRGPSQRVWPRFKILPLTEHRQRILIKRTELPPEQEKILLGSLPNASDDVQRFSLNPMFLGLLCEHVRIGGFFPQNSHSVFESYITTHLRRDEQRLHNKFGISIFQVRQAAERAAFSMTADHHIGLSPSRQDLLQAIARQRLTINGDLYQILDALEYLKLGKSETSNLVGDERQFAFSHRRFQEYFATCIVLQEPDRVSSQALLGNARWRETCVTLLQTRSISENGLVLKQAEIILENVIRQIQNYGNDAIENFRWPENSLYTLKLLQDGLSEQVNSVSRSIRNLIKQILNIPFETGILLDRKLALEVSTLLPDGFMTQMILASIKSRSPWLENIAYKQLGKVRHMVPEIETAIRHMMLEVVRSGNLLRRRNALFAQISRLPQASYLRDILNELLLANIVFIIGNILIALILLLSFVVGGGVFMRSTNNLDDLIGLMGAGFATPLMIYYFYRIYKTDLQSFMMVNVMYFLFSFMFLCIGLISLNVVVLFFAFLLVWPTSVYTLLYRTGSYANPKYWVWSPVLIIFDVIASSILSPLSSNIRRISLSTLWKAMRKTVAFIGWLLLIAVVISLVGLARLGIIPTNVLGAIYVFTLLFSGVILIGLGIYRSVSLFGIKGAFSRFLDEAKRFIIAFGDVFVRPFRIVRNRLEDEQRHKEFMGEFSPQINVYDFLDLIGSQNTKHAPAIVKRVLREKLLHTNPESVHVLRLLSRDIESALIFRREHSKSFMRLNPYWALKNRGDPQQYVDWLIRFQDKHLYSLGWVFGYEFLDDLNRLIEHIEFGAEKNRS